MANVTVTVAEALVGTDVEFLGLNRQAAATSKSLALCTEDKAVLDSVNTGIADLETAISNGTVATGVAGTPSADVVTIQGAAGMAPLTPMQFVTVSMTTPTDAQDAGDVVAATQVVAACTPGNDFKALLQSVTVIDTDDQKANLRIVFFSANTALGTEDSAPDIDDTEILTILGWVDVLVADYVDFGANSVAHKSNVGIVVTPATGTDDIYMAIYTHTASTPTYPSGIITVRLGLI